MMCITALYQSLCMEEFYYSLIKILLIIGMDLIKSTQRRKDESPTTMFKIRTQTILNLDTQLCENPLI